MREKIIRKVNYLNYLAARTVAKIFPFIKVSAHVATVNKLSLKWSQEVIRLKREHSEEMEKIKLLSEDVVKRCSKIDWRRNPPDETYSMMLTLEPRLLGGWMDRRNLDYMAEMFGRLVEREVSSAKFIQKADNLEREKFWKEKNTADGRAVRGL